MTDSLCRFPQCLTIPIRMAPDDFRRIALALEGAVEAAHMGHPDFRVNTRIFATLHGGDRFGIVALSPEQQGEFIEGHPGVYVKTRSLVLPG